MDGQLDGVTVAEDVRVPLPDGTTLSARIWRPASPGPAILEALPYRKRDGTAARDATTHAKFVQEGYACVRLDLRGTGESGGLFDDEYSEQELSDICDAIAWIAEQEWCTGSVGMMGISWGGFNGLQVAARRPPALKAVISSCSSVDRFADDIHYKGGCLLGANISWAGTAMSWFASPPDPALRSDWRKVWLRRLDATPFLAETWHRHNTRDAYWQHGSVCGDFSAIKAAVLILGGWHDGYRNTPLKLLEGAAGPVKAIIGPWNHKYPHLGVPGPAIDFVQEAVRWWDQWLKGKETGAANDPAYRVWAMDSARPDRRAQERDGTWLALEQWPPEGLVVSSLPLGHSGLGVAGDFDRSVRSDAACGDGAGAFFPFGFEPGDLPGDQSGDDAISMTFDGAPATSQHLIVGAPRLKMRIAADQPRAQVCARLCDVRPDGTSMLISHGMLNLRLRNGLDRMEDLDPGTFYDVEVELDHCAYVLPAGHRLRLALSPLYWPFLWPEVGSATLRVTSGVLEVPELKDRPARYEGFAPVPVSGAGVERRVTPSRAVTQSWTTDGTRHDVTDDDRGCVENIEHGLLHGSRVREHWQINSDNPGSACVDITWDRTLKRGDWTVSTQLKLSMESTDDTLILHAHLEAKEAERDVFSREYSAQVPR
ncbi:MAG: CocE/NonD family hydrolase [Pseudomonadota bacterium]